MRHCTKAVVEVDRLQETLPNLRERLARIAALFSLLALVTILSLVSFSPQASAQEACSRTVTPADPLEGIANSLRPGEVLCLRGGEYSDPDNLFKLTAAGSADKRIEIRPYPGETPKLTDHLWLNEQAANVTVRGLQLTSTYQNTLTVYGNDIWVLNNDITNPNEICVLIGAARDGVVFRTTERTLFEDNRVHDCGGQSNNQRHGLYINSATETKILNNKIFDNADRGVQLFPDARQTLVKGNVIDGNGEGINISGKNAHSSSNNVVENNIISNSKVRWNVETWWDEANSVGTNNLIRNNCLYASNSNTSYNGNGGIIQNTPLGFTAENNTVANPMFVDLAGKDFRPRPESPCASIIAGKSNTAPSLTDLQPAPDLQTKNRTPTISATVRDAETDLDKASIKLYVDGSQKTNFAYDRSTDKMTFTPSSNLKVQTHTVKVIAQDAQGLNTTREWKFSVIR